MIMIDPCLGPPSERQRGTVVMDNIEMQKYQLSKEY